MSSLAARFPSTPKLEADRKRHADAESMFCLVEPYLDWELGEIDTTTMDILIFHPDQEAREQHGNVLLLVGELAQAWLHHRRPAEV